MNKENVFRTISTIFQMVFDDDSIILEQNTTFCEMEEWDSLGEIYFISAIEKDFGIKFTDKEVGLLDTVETLIDVIIKKCKETEENIKNAE